MLFKSAVFLLGLAATVAASPVAKPEPQTITVSYAQIEEDANYVISICNNIQSLASEGWNVFQSVNNQFEGNFNVRFSIIIAVCHAPADLFKLL